MFTDIEGSTRLLRRLGPVSYGEALAAHRGALRDAFTVSVWLDRRPPVLTILGPGGAGKTVESATIAHEVEWPWWEAGQLGGAAMMELERVRRNRAGRHLRHERSSKLDLWGADQTAFAPAREKGRLLSIAQAAVGRNRPLLSALTARSPGPATTLGSVT